MAEKTLTERIARLAAPLRRRVAANPGRVYSFDRDGTLQPWGGPVSREKLQELRGRGYKIGCAGGAGAEQQRAQWRDWGIDPDFAISKGQLVQLRDMYPDAEMVHVGDGGDDRDMAESLGYRYVHPGELVREGKPAPPEEPVVMAAGVACPRCRGSKVQILAVSHTGAQVSYRARCRDCGLRFSYKESGAAGE